MKKYLLLIPLILLPLILSGCGNNKTSLKYDYDGVLKIPIEEKHLINIGETNLVDIKDVIQTKIKECKEMSDENFDCSVAYIDKEKVKCNCIGNDYPISFKEIELKY